jgi:hypothetical protein
VGWLGRETTASAPTVTVLLAVVQVLVSAGQIRLLGMKTHAYTVDLELHLCNKRADLATITKRCCQCKCWVRVLQHFKTPGSCTCAPSLDRPSFFSPIYLVE